MRMLVLARHFAAALSLLTLASHAALGQSDELLEAYDRFEAFQRQGRVEEAMVHGKKALKLSLDELGFNNWDTALLIANLAYLEATQGNFDEAMTQYEIVLKIFERVVGTEHPNVAWALGQIAWLRQVEGNYTAAESLLRRALAIMEKTQELDPLEMSRTLRNTRHFFG